MVTVLTKVMLEYIAGTEQMPHKLAQILLETTMAMFLELTLILVQMGFLQLEHPMILEAEDKLD